jgi:deoxyribodipyrimidine photo-lyase
MWFRRDLRLSDNRALFAAVRDSDALSAIFFVTPHQWARHFESPGKTAFWQACLFEVRQKLAALGVRLKVCTVESFARIPAEITDYARKNGCDRVYFNKEYEFNERKRDDEVTARLAAAGVAVKSYHDRVLLDPGKILTGSGSFYTVFTPFSRSWKGIAARNDWKPLAPPQKVFAEPFVITDKMTDHEAQWRSDLWPAGETAALERLHDFLQHGLDEYHICRDFPAKAGTSMLSPWLAAGAISPRQCLAGLLDKNKNAFLQPDSGAGVWLNELIWRDFYCHVLVGFPWVGCSEPFKRKTAMLKWNNDEKLLEAWKNGMTGYPLVDAAMRQLQQTGWMHNRLRMVAAMFLSKSLFIDWRAGEKYFMQQLLDGDLAANNGGWQWSASTGTDAVPYFRIFNPFSQSSRFDAEGEFIKKFCPELAPLPAAVLHDAKKLVAHCRSHKISYPEPVVDHQIARIRVMAAFKALD